MYIKCIRFDLVECLGQINHFRLFNAKSSLYIYSKYIRFDLVEFYGISTIVGHLMPNFLYIYVLNIYDLIGLTKTNSMSLREKESADMDLELSLWFSNVLVCCFRLHSYVSGVIFVSLYIFVGGVEHPSLSLHFS